MEGRHWVKAGLAVAASAVALGLAGCHTTPKPRVMILAPSVCQDFTVSIYFEPGSASLGPEAERLIAAAADKSSACDVTGVNVTGLADAPGTHEANLALSKRRAATVTRALYQRGFRAVVFQVYSAGDLGAQSAAGETHPLRRRVDVQIHLAPKSGAR
jgi:outer membrane protein OmpA-like peptidoglycan-associated protein